jgi:methylase of polypeptide subunit release factors
LNAVEIEQAITDLAEQLFDRENFPYAFLEAFGNKETTIKRLRAGASNKSDLGGVLQTSHIHILTCEAGQVPNTLKALKNSGANAKAKAKFILATDGTDLEAEDLASGETVACAYKDFPDHFGFFLPLAGITTVRQIAENSFDIRATSRLNRLYVQLLKDNPEWGTAARRHDMNHFMARLIFCFFAEDTSIFARKSLFTDTIAQMSAHDSSNTHEVISTLFQAMNAADKERDRAGLPRWSNAFPYVNGGLFSGNMDVPRFSKIARSYLLHIGTLDWTKINPDIFGSMIQAVAEDEERGGLGMHYTSVPNILKVLNPLFLDDLRAKLVEAGDNPRTLLNLRKRMAKLRVFDPACGSGNFLVIAYKEMRALEAEINMRRGEPDLRSEIPLTNFRGIELRDFPAEIARLALVIAEYQGDVLYRGQKLALAEFLPLRAENWITWGNALRLDWLSICPPTGTGVKLQGDDLFNTPLDQVQIDFENEGGETYICGNPPYVGGKKQTADQKQDMVRIFGKGQHKNLDYVCGFLVKAAASLEMATKVALVTTNSVAQGTHVPVLWPIIRRLGCQIEFAYETFKWANNAQRNAGVSCTIIGLTKNGAAAKYIYSEASRRLVANVNAYLVDGPAIIVESKSTNSNSLSRMITGNAAYDGGHLFLTPDEARALIRQVPDAKARLRRVSGTSEFIDGVTRYCLWLDDDDLSFVTSVPEISSRIDRVLEYRQTGGEVAATLTGRPHQFRYRNTCRTAQILVPQVSSERREYLPVGLLAPDVVITHLAHAIYDPTLVDFSVLVSKLHLAWVATICGKLETRIRYASNLGWNTFPVPTLTDKNKADLARCAEEILLVREHHFPETIANLYDPDNMPDDLRAAHERNDEVLERIYVGRRFKNDTERLEKLFDLYAKTTASAGAPAKGKVVARA